MSRMSSEEVDRRIAAKRTIYPRIPGQPAQDSIIIENGTTPLEKPSAAAVHQIDATVPRMERTNDPVKSKVGQPGGKIGDNYTAASSEGSESVTIGQGADAVTMRKSSLSGWEARFTKSASDYQVILADGTVVNSTHEINRLVHAALYRIKTSKAGK